jgi:c-di-AMP phosphodiesterase-like protein
MMDKLVLPFPCVKLDKDMQIIETNHAFGNWLNECKEPKTLSDIVGEVSLDKHTQRIKLEGKYYDMYVSDYDEGHYVFFIHNPYINKDGMVESHVMVALLLIDNYAEVEENIDETRLPHLMAIIERKINDYFRNLGGIVRKFERDKYIIILNRDQLEFLKESKFPIVNQISSVEIGNIPVTISMGIGYNGCTVNEDMELARGALDLALGRGGNQIVIKDSDERYEYYGGDDKEVIKNSRVRARVKAYGLVELLLSASDVIVMGHKNPDLDSLGSAAGVFAIAGFYGKKCHIVLNEVTSAVSALYKRLIKDERYDDCFINSEQAIKMIKRRTLLIVVDTHRVMLTECPELLKLTKKIVVFDHHRKCADAIENYSLTYHEAYASSTSEMITEMLMYIKGVRVSRNEIEGLLAGITVDTKNFAFKTGIKTFEAAAFLKKNGADTISVRRLFKNSMDDYLARSEIVRSAEIIHDNMAISVLEREVDNPSVLIAQAADELLNIQGIEVSYVLCRKGNVIHISARSLGGVNVQKLMEKLGGGGHQAGAAAQLRDTTIDEARTLLLEKIDEYLEEVKK